MVHIRHPFATIDDCVVLSFTRVGVVEILCHATRLLCSQAFPAMRQDFNWSSVIVGNILIGVNVRYVPFHWQLYASNATLLVQL